MLIELLSQPNISGLWVDTTQKNIDSYVDRYFRVILRPIWNLCDYNQQKKILKLPNGSYIDFGSAERPENLEGFQYHRGVLNEAGIILKKESLWYNTLLPMFKGEHTKVKIVGTPKSKNMFHKLFTRGNSGDPDYKSFHFSAYDSPFWNAPEIEQFRLTMPEAVFRQEMLAEFLEGAGSVFRNIGAGIKAPQSDLKMDIMAVDLAKHQDFTVIMLGNRAARQVTKIDRFNQIDWSFQKNRIYNAWLTAGKPKCIIDSTGVGDPIFDDLKAAGMNIEGYKFTSTSKQELIQGLSVAMDNGEIFYPEDSTLLSELEIFGYDISPSGNIRYNAPEGFHDDTVVTLAMFNYLCASAVEVRIGWL